MSLPCPKCGTAVAGDTYFRCASCGHSFMRMPPPRDPNEPPSVWRRYGKLLAGAGGLLLLVSLVPYGQLASKMHKRRVEGRELESRAGVVPEGERMQWDPSAGPPHELPDGSFVGRFKVAEGEQSMLYMGGFDGASLARKWKLGPLGTIEAAHAASHVDVVGDRVLVTDTAPSLRVLAGADGSELAKAALPAPAKRLCNGWVELPDGWQAVDLATGALTAGTPPATCTPPTQPPCGSVLRFRKGWHHARCEARPPELYALVDGEASVAIAGPELAVVGPRWRQKEPGAKADTGTVADLVEGRVVVQYRMAAGGNTRLGAWNASTGASEWQVEVPKTEKGSMASAMTVTATRVYLPHWTWLDVFDVKTGAFLGTVGTY